MIVLSRSALAQDAEIAAAITAFDEAQVLVEQGDYAAACARFADSQRLDPQLGTLLHLGNCLELNGQTASAWSAFRDAAELAERRDDARQQVARDRAEQLGSRLSRLQLALPSSAPEGLRISRNGVAVPRSLWTAAIPLDPGSYTIEASAPGHRSWHALVEVAGPGEVTELRIPPLEATAEGNDDPTPERAATGGVQEDRSFLVRKWPALTAAGVGVAGATVWAVFGVQSLRARADARDHCDADGICDARGVELRQDAIDAGNVATSAMIVTGVGLASAAVFWFTLDGEAAGKTPTQGALRPRFGVGAGTIRVVGSW